MREDDKAMLKGKDFGSAIGVAITKKLGKGVVKSKAEIARYFGMKPPSLSDWVKKGSVSKDKLPELWRYFADVAGPDHWGMTPDEWPAGLPVTTTDEPQKTEEPRAPVYKVSKTQRQKDIDELLRTVEKINDRGMSALLYAARQVADQFPIIKQTPKSSA